MLPKNNILPFCCAYDLAVHPLIDNKKLDIKYIEEMNKMAVTLNKASFSLLNKFAIPEYILDNFIEKKDFNRHFSICDKYRNTLINIINIINENSKVLYVFLDDIICGVVNFDTNYDFDYELIKSDRAYTDDNIKNLEESICMCLEANYGALSQEINKDQKYLVMIPVICLSIKNHPINVIYPNEGYINYFEKYKYN